MLKRLDLLPKEHLMNKYSQISGKDMSKVEEIVDREGIETIADLLEEHLVRQNIGEGVYG